MFCITYQEPQGVEAFFPSVASPAEGLQARHSGKVKGGGGVKQRKFRGRIMA